MKTERIVDESKYCPICIEKLEKISKKLDKTNRTIWLRCPSCGYTTRPETPHQYQKRLEEFEKTHNIGSNKYK